MDVIGIICEYNPFHNGHIYHLKKCRELFPQSTIILCLNGYFSERGQVSILTKEDKVKIALSYGVDLVIELPVFYGTQAGDFFAYASITLLNALGITHLVFGSETTDLDKLSMLAQKQLDKDFKITKCHHENYPTLLAKALGEENTILPNDLLGISYLKAIYQINPKIQPVLIKRTSSFHDTSSIEDVISASNIQEKLKKGLDVSSFLPKKAFEALKEKDNEMFFSLLKYQISMSEDLSLYIDVTEGLENKLKKCVLEVSSYEELLQKLKSKRYTYNRLQRMLIHILLGMKKEKIPLTYIRLLGFNEKGSLYLKEHKKDFLYPTKVDFTSPIYQYEMKASLLYDSIMKTKTYDFERRNKPVYTNTRESNQK